MNYLSGLMGVGRVKYTHQAQLRESVSFHPNCISVIVSSDWAQSTVCVCVCVWCVVCGVWYDGW
jgi:hypothetical protein